MATTIDLTGGNINKAAPVWFTKTKNAISVLADAAVVILLSAGLAKDNSLLILVIRVGISAVFNALNSVLADDTAPQPTKE
jgi:hypothetical protein